MDINDDLEVIDTLDTQLIWLRGVENIATQAASHPEAVNVKDLASLLVNGCRRTEKDIEGVIHYLEEKEANNICRDINGAEAE